MGLLDNALFAIGNLVTGDVKDATKYWAETTRVASGQAKTVANTAEKVASAVVEKPLATAQVAVGGVLIATGIGAAAGVALVTKGAIDLTAQALANATAPDNPKARTAASVELEAQRAKASGGVNAAENRPKASTSPAAVVRVEAPPAPPVPPPPPDVSLRAFVRDVFGV